MSHVMSFCLRIGDVSLDHLVKAMSTRFLYCNVTNFLSMTSKFIETSVKTM